MSDNFNTKRPPAATTSKSSRSITSRPSRFDDPRIVRVSRALGGRKDRHSKVCTVRGLRDTRVRLSVPTAIQLYDLQERLGLNQPSKVADWLLDAAKHEIDELPPLHFPQGTTAFGVNLLNFQEPVLDFYLGISSKDDELMISHENCRDEEKYWARLSIQEQRQSHDHHFENNYNNQALLSNSTSTYNSVLRSDPSPSQHEDWHSLTTNVVPSTSHHHHHHHEVVVYHQQTGLVSTQSSYFPLMINNGEVNFKRSQSS